VTAARSRATLILGLGNPILRDDRVGLEVARALHALRAGEAELALASVGGLELLHLVEGYRRVLIVDALEPGAACALAPGEVAELAVEELRALPAATSPHTASLGCCLELGARCGLEMPAEVRVFVVGARDTRSFDERCSPEVEAALPAAVAEIERAFFV
jgi:hydrogenase maturation protease